MGNLKSGFGITLAAGLRLATRRLVLLLLISSMAFAVPITWTLTGVTFTDGGTASGSFVFDTSNPSVATSINIITTPGTTLVAGATYHNLFFAGVGGLGFLTSPTITIGTTRDFLMNLASPMTNAGGTINFNTAASLEYVCADAPCNMAGVSRNMSAGTIVGVPAITTPPPGTPIPSSILLVMTGMLMLLGWYRLRTRATG